MKANDFPPLGLINDPDGEPPLPIARNLEEGADYAPDWRDKVAQDYICGIKQVANHKSKLAAILDKEEDPFVRELVQFHRGVSFENQLSVERAVRCNRDAATARAIKAMVIAGKPSEKIAQIVPAPIEYFEKLFFDARRYLDQKFWIRNLCYGENGHRWLQIAFQRGWAGVSEVVLGHGPKGPRNMQHSASILHGRLEDYIFGLEADNVQVSEKDSERLTRVCQLNSSGALPFLDDPPDGVVDDQEIPPDIKALSPLDREKVYHLIRLLHKAVALHEAGKQNGEAPDSPEQQNEKTTPS